MCGNETVATRDGSASRQADCFDCNWLPEIVNVEIRRQASDAIGEFGVSGPKLGLSVPPEPVLIRLSFALTHASKSDVRNTFGRHTGNTVERLKPLSCYQYAD